MTTESTNDGTAFIQPLCIGLTIDGRDLNITPLVIADLPNLLLHSMPVLASLQVAGPGFFERLMAKDLHIDEVAGILTSVAVNGENYIQILAIGCRQPAEWVGSLLPDRIIELLFAVLEVNADFFRKALPLILLVAARAQANAAARAAQSSVTPTPSTS